MKRALGPVPLQVRMLCLVLDQLAPVEHQSHVFVGHLHEARHIVLAGERDRAVLHPLGHAVVSAKDDLAHALHRRLALRLLVGKPAVDLRVLQLRYSRSEVSGGTGSARAWRTWIPAPIAAPNRGPAR